MKIEDLIKPQGGRKALMTEAAKEMEMVMGDLMEMVIQIAMVIQMGVEIQMEMGNHPGEGKNLLKEMENQVEVMGDQTPVMMGVGMGPPLPHQILPLLEEENIGGPDLFMYFKDLQDHQVR